MAEKKKTDTKKRGFVGSIVKATRPSSKPKAEKEEKEPKELKAAKEPKSSKKRAADKKESPKAAAKKAAAPGVEQKRETAEAAAAKETALREEARSTVKEIPQATAKGLPEVETPVEGDYPVMYIESGAYQTTFNKMFMQRKPWEPVNPKHILSFMPGTVEKIMVKRGDKVAEGDALLIFRAMKMSNNMMSPVSGKIVAINVSEGENVPKNTLMIEIE